jgi:hypothetical protein
MRSQQWMWPGLVSVRTMPPMPVIKSKHDDLHWIRSLMRSNRKARAVMATNGGSKVHIPIAMTRRTIENR